MPAKNVTKEYVEEGYYHIYNRGVEKRLIFQDEQDYSVFLSYLKDYLLPKDSKTLENKLLNPTLSPKDRDKILKLLKMNNFSEEITLIAYCLMPNHFHLLVKQKSSNSINKFMNSLSTRYVMYFNKKYKRVGSLFQDTYKAVLVETDPQLLHLSRYIHKQALSLPSLGSGGQPSSYPAFIGQQTITWIHPEDILTHFSYKNPKLTYKSFVNEEDELEYIYKFIIEDF